METSAAAQATEALIQDYGKLVFHVIYGLTGHWQESEDLTQETFLQAFRGIEAARAASGPQFQAKAWLMRIAINTVRMQRRRQKALRFLPLAAWQDERQAGESRDEVHEEIADADDLETLIAERDTVQRCMDQLPESLRAPLLLSVVAGFSQRELAAILALNEATLRQRLSRARKAFQRLYAQECGEHIPAEARATPSRSGVLRSRGHLRRRSAALQPVGLSARARAATLVP
ncbi:MAG TPA: sigma-70 family RNA polymerase sigma factor [Ktedonobacteraceae bacterium]|nr:sigma-70 family RNA polymerase sigma factor [Ktedonobacteraceae bacterium]